MYLITEKKWNKILPPDGSTKQIPSKTINLNLSLSEWFKNKYDQDEKAFDKQNSSEERKIIINNKNIKDVYIYQSAIARNLYPLVTSENLLRQ